MKKLLQIALLLLLICVLFTGCAFLEDVLGNISDAGSADAPTLVGTAGDTVVENACYLYTPQIVEDVFRYLDEIYSEKYPSLGLRWEHGTGVDQRIMTALAKKITSGCATDTEKADAIFTWIVENIPYQEVASPFSYDTLYTGKGNCLSKAMLMQDLCRVLGIPAVYSDGFRGNMKTFSVEDMHGLKEDGHAWLFIYLDDQWVLYDPTWGTAYVTDRDFIAKNFYIDKVGGITPIYDENNLPPFGNPNGNFCYMNGMFTSLCNGQPSNEYGGSIMNFCMNVNAYVHGGDPIGSVGIFYWDGPAAFAFVGMEEYELYTNGWVGYGESGFLWGNVGYAYENGILASETIVQRGNDTFYLSGGTSNKLCLPGESYRLINGKVTVDRSYIGKIWEPHENMLPEGEYTYTWFSTNESVATVDENGVVTCHQEGSASICVQIVGTGMHGNEEFVMTQEQNPWVVIYEGGNATETKYYGFSMHVEFSNDISRPAEYAVLDSGGPAYIDLTETAHNGALDIYPVMTDDFLMMFDPVGDVITLPTAKNAKGYFILPGTYENALQYPYDFEVPLAEGSILLDRNKLKEFTLVNTEKWGEMWYLPLTEEGVDAFGPGTGYEQDDIDFGGIAIPTDQLHQNGMWEPDVYSATPVDNVITTELLPVIPELPATNWTPIFAEDLQHVVDQGCNWEIIVTGNSVVMDTAAMEHLLNMPDDSFLSFWMVKMDMDWCTHGMQVRLGRLATVGIYNIHMEAGNTWIHDLGGGTVTVTVPLEDNGGTYGAYLVDRDGNLMEIPSTVNGDGTITFVSPYFANYAIIDTSLTPVT